MKNALENIIQDERLKEYPLFKDFFLFKEKGLRKAAFNSLDSLISDVKEQEIE